MDEMRTEKLRDELEAGQQSELSIPIDELCERYERLYAGAISDALRERALLDRAFPPNIMPLEEDVTVAGIAFTVKSAPDPTFSGEMQMRANMLEEMHDHAICVWDADDDGVSSQWGEVMTTTASKRGCKGAVIQGGLRDARQVLERDFPVFYSYRTANGALGRSRIQQFQTSIRIGTVLVKPGDIVFGDIDGVVVVPRDIAVEVLERAEEIRDTDSQVKEWVEEGASANDVVDRGGYF